MKKALIALSVMTFLMVGIVAINSVMAKQVSSSVYDDPPKKDVKAKKSCCTAIEAKNCNTPCGDKAAVKPESKNQASSTTTQTTSDKKETVKTDPDKK